MQLKITITLVTLLFAIAVSQPVDVSLVESWIFDDNKETSWNYAISKANSHKLVVVSCNSNVEDSPTKNCNVSIHTHGFNGEKSRKSCKLQESVGNNKLLFKIYALSEEKMVVTFTEDLNINKLRLTLRIVNLDNCESSSGIPITSDNGLELYFHKFVRHANSFDIISKSEECPSNYCVETYDFEGKLLKTHQDLGTLVNKKIFNDILKIDNIVHPNSEEGYFIADSKDLQTNLVFSPATEIVKKQEKKVYDYVYTNGSGVSSVCWYAGFDDTKIECSYVESKGVVKSVAYEFTESVSLTSLFNLPGNEFLLLAKVANASTDETKFIVLKAHSDGQWTTLKTTTLAQAKVDSTIISQDDVDRFCISFLGLQDPDASISELIWRTRCQQF